MACCVLVMAFVAQLFALRRRVRLALGLPVGDWYEDDPQPGIRAVWGPKLRGLLRNSPARVVLVTVAVAEIAFVVVAAPGAQGLIAEHRRHARQAWEYVTSFGVYADVASLWCATSDPQTRGDQSAARQ
jgi:hypothetical protein